MLWNMTLTGQITHEAEQRVTDRGITDKERLAGDGEFGKLSKKRRLASVEESEDSDMGCLQ